MIVLIPIMMSLLISGVNAETVEVQEPQEVEIIDIEAPEVEHDYPTITIWDKDSLIVYDYPTEYPADCYVYSTALDLSFHKYGCKYLDNNSTVYILNREDAINMGLYPCNKCNP